MTNTKKIISVLAFAIILFGSLSLVSFKVEAHCDTLDGPVVETARKALDKGDVTPVLKWVKKAYEAEIREAFKKTLTVRAKGTEAKELADTYFFETLVRLHRAGEGAPYDGVKPAGTVEPIVVATDEALATGKIDELTKELSGKLKEGILERFHRVLETKKHANDSVIAGREYVEAYVVFLHYVERLHLDLSGHTTAHGDEDVAKTEPHQD